MQMKGVTLLRLLLVLVQIKILWSLQEVIKDSSNPVRSLNEKNSLVKTSSRKIIKFIRKSAKNALKETTLNKENKLQVQSGKSYDVMYRDPDVESITHIVQDEVIEGHEQVDSDYEDSEIETNIPSTKVYFWGKWSKWSKCSRSCGGGVQIKTRKCTEKNQSDSNFSTFDFEPLLNGTHKGCVGLHKRYRICNDKECTYNRNESFRFQQCSLHNHVPYHGKLYNWEPYIKENNECELNCKPKGLKYYATLNATVINGTPCKRSAVYFERHYRGRAVCVEGICKAVHSSGAIRGDTTSDSTVRCGSVLCEPILRVFSKSVLPHGYFHITTIPVGAANISITELDYSENLLVLKSEDDISIINSEHERSKSGTYKYNENSFEYTSDEENGKLERITSNGFLSKAVDLLVLIKDKNPGIEYKYYVPVSSNSVADEDDSDTQWNEMGVPLDYGAGKEMDNADDNNTIESTSTHPSHKKKKKLEWRLVGFGHCSKTCGGGFRSPIFRCTRDIPTRYYSPRRCKHVEKPVFNELIFRCNTQECPGYWRIERWDECYCNNGKGYRERVVKCVRELTTGAVTQVNESLCTEEKPFHEETCECPRHIRKRVSRQRMERPVHPRVHSHGTESVVTINRTVDINIVFRENGDKSGVWLMSLWNNQCSVECGSGVEHRSIFCDRTYPYSERCDLRITPDTSRPCMGERKCKTGVWFTGQWGECTGDCFNLNQKRDVFCIRNSMVVDDEECPPEQKPTDSKNCTINGVNYCRARWHYSEWTECSRTCGGGTQRRFVKCLEIDVLANILKESKNCRYLEREPIYSACNIQDCPEAIVDPKVNRIQNDLDSSCHDEYSNCHLINKERLCNLKYYQRHCCYTCN